MSLDVRHRHVIAAPAAIVWGLLADFSTWPRWWADCAAVQRRDSRPLCEGSRVELVVSPAGRERTLVCVVDLLSDGRSLTLVAERWLFNATVTWTLRDAAGDSTHLAVHGAFGGLAAGRLGLGPELLESCLRRQGRGLAKAAERAL